MTPLRRRLLEDMGIRNLVDNTQSAYLQQIIAYSKHFHRSPEERGPEEVRAYQVYLTPTRLLAPSSVGVATGRLALPVQSHAQTRLGGRRNTDAQATVQAAGHSEPRGSDAVSQLSPQHQTPRDSRDRLRGGLAHLRGHPPQSHRHRQPAHDAAR